MAAGGPWLVTGAAGMLGTDLVALLRERGRPVTAAARADLDVTDPAAVERAVGGHRVVVNCAAHTAVDDAEADEAGAFAVNALGAVHVARAAAAAGAVLVHLSTDYVFSGDADAPYAEDAPVAPRSAYGRTKAAGEWAVRAACPGALVVRTAWLYGAGGRCFPRTVAKALGERQHLDVVDDQRGQPTWTRDVAALVLDLVDAGAGDLVDAGAGDLVDARTGGLVDAGAGGGTYHATSSGSTTWHGLARAVAEHVGADPARVRPCSSAAVARPAPRPASSVLGHDALVRLGVAPIGPWRQRWAVAAGEVLAAEVPSGGGRPPQRSWRSSRSSR